MLQARRRLADLLGVPAPIVPVDGGQPEPARLAELAAEAERLHELAARLQREAGRVAERVRQAEARLHAVHPTI